ncbi:exosortase-associated protein EpsI, B-type [Derxia lacustris]|uniref:exosortase-associated protein EpsI, B-type n=1 Tax=Derxia lacustris TaxID=764842 RepID=UPI000A177831|nr:exosortase-associated protein EpsI, B-type [Derxia lacustris]
MSAPPLPPAAGSGPAPLRRAVVASLLMSAAALGTAALTPRLHRADVIGPPRLDASLPARFAGWQLEPAPVQVVNPPARELLDRIYAEVLARSYANARGDRVMLTIAYGNDQRDGLQLHYPEVCYPAQGFEIVAKRDVTLSLPGGSIPARQLETVLRNRRFEPVTYWTTVGDLAVRGGIDKKLAEMRYGLHGTIPDGLLFRVSSIDRDSAHAFAVQRQFVADLLANLPPALRLRLAGF